MPLPIVTPKANTNGFRECLRNHATRYEQRSLDALKPNPRNARTHSAQQLRLIEKLIREFGFINPIIINAEGQILAGHARYAVARRLRFTEVPIVEIDYLTRAEQQAYVLADNKLAEMAGWDADLLKVQLEELDDLDFDLELTGFSGPEIEALLDPTIGSRDEIIPEPKLGPPVSQLGDLWLLGPHRLYCGSALDASSYAALMGDERAGVVFADPPYNVPIQGHVSGHGKVRHREFAMASGEMSSEAFTMFLRTTFEHLVTYTEDGSIHFQCIDWRHMGEMLAASKGVYSEFKNLVVWNKDNGGMGALYRSKHELVFVFKAGTANHCNNVELGRHGRNRTNVWDYAGQNTFHRSRDRELGSHPTVKPVALVSDALRDVSRRGDLVLDPFSGSGTTLIAAERTRRIGRAIELDPVYVDVALRRYADATGQPPRLAATGQSFSEVAARRAVLVPANDGQLEVGDAA